MDANGYEGYELKTGFIRAKTLFSAESTQANLEGVANFCSFALCLAKRSAVY
jgi:hypothetical protein